jgi:hypothetical protein
LKINIILFAFVGQNYIVKINNSFCIIHQILNIHKNDILTFKNVSKSIIDITNFKLNISKL